MTVEEVYTRFKQALNEHEIIERRTSKLVHKFQVGKISKSQLIPTMNARRNQQKDIFDILKELPKFSERHEVMALAHKYIASIEPQLYQDLINKQLTADFDEQSRCRYERAAEVYQTYQEIDEHVKAFAL